MIEAVLPTLRRYARAVTGDQAMGDAMADTAVRTTAPVSNVSEGRLSLFRAIENQLRDLSTPANEDGAVRVAEASRRVLLLAELAGLTVPETASISGLGENDVVKLIQSGRASNDAVGPVNVFIIEDEPLIAAHLAGITRQMGHNVIGTAATAAAAVSACREHAPDILLSDVMLGEDATGADAAREISALHDIPVVFITAFPQAQLRGAKGEPAYLIEKPFRANTVKAVVTQALLHRTEQRRAS
ncbi:MAG: response regulator [Pseudomonadota bacterium]|nr:response regulator [Pseudomonadota bacterium]